MRIAMIGTGYVGLVSGACFADFGHQVCCIDKDSAKIDGLQAGKMPIWEPGLEAIVKVNAERGRLTFTTSLPEGVKDAEAVFIAVGTPARRGDGHADLTFVFEAVRELARVIRPGTVVVTKSTVPVGTGDEIERILREEGVSDVSVASNPEFLREGQAVRDFLEPERIVIGCDDPGAAVRVSDLYRGLRAPLLVTDPASAEMIKYASNAFLATKVSFINAIANLCEAVDADVREVALGMGYDKRIGFEFLKPGPGWGGSCFPKDTRALVRIAEDAGYDFGLLKGVIQVNDEQVERVTTKVERMAGGPLDGAVIAVWGLTFKARTDDLRSSPSLEVIRRLRDRGAVVQAFDPTVRRQLDGIEVRDDPYAACDGAAVLVVLTEWDEFRWVDFGKVRDALARPVIVDARNLLDPAALRRQGFTYEGVGR